MTLIHWQKEEYIQGILHYSFKTSVRLYDISALMDLLNHTKGSYDKLYSRHIKILCKKYRREIILYLYQESGRNMSSMKSIFVNDSKLEPILINRNAIYQILGGILHTSLVLQLISYQGSMIQRKL